MIEFHVAFVVLLVGTEAAFTWLAVLDLRHGERTVRAESEWVEETLGVEDPERLLDYQRVKTGLGLLETWVTLGAVLFALYSGVFADATAALESTGLGPVARGVVFVVGAVAAFSALSWPFDAVDTFVAEEVYGFNQQSPRLWARDKLVGLVIGLVIAGALGGAVLWFVDALPGVWWVAAWALFVAFSLVMQVVYPRVIAPLFYDFDPVETGELRDAVDDVFERAGFACEQVYEMDASRRSSHSNAYFIGFGRTKRVVLFDTLVEQMTLPAIQSVLAHELAHWKRAHVWKRMAAGAAKTGIVLAALGWLLDQPWLYGMFDVAPTAYAGLALALLWVRPVDRWVAPVENRLYLAHEREADAFAVEVMGDDDPMVDALTVLAGENLSNPFPHPWYAAFHHSHPPVPERIRTIRGRADDGGDPDPESESVAES